MDNNNSLFLGDDLCNELGVTPMELAKGCASGKIKAYHPSSKREILPSNLCYSEFKYEDSPIKFMVESIGNNATIAIRDTTSKYIDIEINRIPVNGERDSFKKTSSQKKEIEFNNRLINIANEYRECDRRNINCDTIEYKGKKYILYFRTSKLSSQNIVYPTNKYVFTLRGNKNIYNLEFIYIIENGDEIHYEPISTKIVCEDVNSSSGARKCIKSCDFSKIRFLTKPHILRESSIKIDKARYLYDIKYRNMVDKYSILKQQRELTYRSHNNGRILFLEDDFFKFEFEEYKFDNLLLSDREIIKKFYKCILNMLFRKEDVKKILPNNTEEQIRKNTKKFILTMINDELQSKNLSDKDKEILSAYILQAKGYTNAQVYGELHPHVQEYITCG